MLSKRLQISRKVLAYFIAIMILFSGSMSYLAYNIGFTNAQGIGLTANTLTGGTLPGASTYTVFLDGGSFYAKNQWGTIVYSGTNATTVLTSAASGAVDGKLLIKNGNYGVASFQILNNTHVEIESGVNTGVTYTFASGFCGVIADNRYDKTIYAKNGLPQSIGAYNWVNDPMTLIRSETTNNYTKIMLSPNGAGSGGWTSLLQLANTDVTASATNYEMMEMTWENNYAYINVWGHGTGENRTFALMLQGQTLFKLDMGDPGTYGQTGDFFLWCGAPLHMNGTSGWTNLIDLSLNGTGVLAGSSTTPSDDVALFCKIPAGTIFNSASRTTLCVYDTKLGGSNGLALVYPFPENGQDNSYVNATTAFITIQPVARDYSNTVANQLRVYVDNITPWNYTTLADIELYIELRY